MYLLFACFCLHLLAFALFLVAFACFCLLLLAFARFCLLLLALRQFPVMPGWLRMKPGKSGLTRACRVSSTFALKRSPKVLSSCSGSFCVFSEARRASDATRKFRLRQNLQSFINFCFETFSESALELLGLFLGVFGSARIQIAIACFCLLLIAFACFCLLLLAGASANRSSIMILLAFACFCLLFFAFACFCLLLLASACFCLLLLNFACVLVACACFKPEMYL